MYTNGTKTVDTPSNQNTAHQKELAQLAQDSVLEPALSTKILEAIDMLVVVLSAQGQIVWVNPACERFTGFALVEVQGQCLWDILIPPEQVANAQEVFHKLVLDQHPSHSENQWLTHDGQQRLLAWSNTVVQDSAGNVTHVIGMGQDITQSRQAEQAQYKREALLHALFDTISDSIMVWDQYYTYLYVNQVATSYFGIPSEQVCGKHIHDGLSHMPDVLGLCLSRIDQVFATGEPLAVEDTFAIGDRWVTSTSTWSPIRDAQGDIFAVSVVYRDMTEQREAEAALRSTSERLEFALEGSNTGVWDWYITTNGAYLSPRYKHMLGYTPDELPDTPESWFHNIHPQDVPHVQQILQDYLEGRSKVYEVEYRLRHKSGEWLWMVSRGEVVDRTDQGQPVRMTGTITDITARKQIEDELRMTSERLQFALEGGNMEVWDWNIPTNVAYLSPRYKEMLGYGPDKPLDTPELWFSINHPDDISRVQQVLQDCLEGHNKVCEVEHRMQHISGEWVWVLSRGKVVEHDNQGQPVRMTGTITDISARKRIEDELYIANERLEFALEGSNMGVWDWYMATQKAYFSPHYKRLLGYTPDELPNTPETWFNNIHPEDVTRAQQSLQDYLEEHSGVYEIEHRLRHKSGEWLWMLGRGKVVEHDDQGRPLRMTGTNTDISERKRAEGELRLFQAMFENASDPIAIVRASDGIITHYNRAYRTQYRCGDEHLEQPISVIVAPQDQAQLPGILEQIKEQGIWQGQLTHVRQDGVTFPALESCFTINDGLDNVVSMVGIVRDITDVLEARLQQQRIEAQQLAIRELSTPLLPISDTTVIMPLIGSIDSARAQQIMEALLEGVAAHKASIALLDITGVQVIDTQVAHALIQAAQAAQLLGAQVVLTGIQPQIAQTLVHLAVDLRGIVTRSTLQAGIAYAFQGKTTR